jgi:hypothetical protein
VGVLLAALLLHACSESFPPEDRGALVSMRVSPEETTVYTSPSGAEPFPFELFFTRADGLEEPLAEAEWSLSNRTVGTIEADGTFTPSANNGGVSNVTARFAGVEASALLTVIYQEEVVQEGVDPASFEVPRTPHDGLWAYPPDGVNLPRNTPSLVFQWVDVGASAARLRFRSKVTDLTVYTTGTSWTADEDTWAALVGTNAGGSVEVELSLLVGTEVWSEDIITVNVNRFDARGNIYYWSTSASGIRKIPYGSGAEDFLTAATTGYCVGCHSVRGDQIAFTYDGGNGALGLRSLDGSTVQMGHDSGVYGNFNTLSPDGNWMFVAFQGALLLYDAHTGAFVQEVAVGQAITHPDWSPDGTRVVLVLRNGGEDWTFSGGRVAILDVAPGPSFSAPRVVFDPGEPYNAYYPSWSPDSEWIAFNLSTGDGYADPDAMVWVVDAEGSMAVELTAANVTSGITNSLPRWAPLPDDDVLWLAFSSNRNYGTVTAGNPQLWVTGFDPARAVLGLDPSWPAFWLPGQDPAQNNHIPIWAE